MLVLAILRQLAGRSWLALRDWCGDSAYDRYRSAAGRRQDTRPLSRKAFYLDQLERRYSRPSRCC